MLIASRLPVSRVAAAHRSVTVPCRAQGLGLGTSPALAVLGVYVPSRDRSPEKVARKEEFISSLLASIEALPAEQRRQLVLLGDYNAVARDHDPALPGFFPYEYDFHEELVCLGLRPAHELKPYGKLPAPQLDRPNRARLPLRLRSPRRRSQRAHHRCRYLHGPRAAAPLRSRRARYPPAPRLSRLTPRPPPRAARGRARRLNRGRFARRRQIAP